MGQHFLSQFFNIIISLEYDGQRHLSEMGLCKRVSCVVQIACLLAYRLLKIDKVGSVPV